MSKSHDSIRVSNIIDRTTGKQVTAAQIVDTVDTVEQGGGGGVDPATPFTWTAGVADVKMGTELYPGSTSVQISQLHEIPGGSHTAYNAEGHVPFGALVFAAESVFVNASEVNYVQRWGGIAYEPVGVAPPGFILLEKKEADPTNGSHLWSMGGLIGIEVDTVAETKVSSLGDSGSGSVEVRTDDTTGQVDVHLSPSVGTQGFTYLENAVTAADDTAAGIAGVPTGALYVTAIGEVRIKL